ncbi:MAG: ribonuclease III domain-containing protein [Oscillospiraceae bacterium]|nr:ribonuclease III domain-containing protein [Oscillospiraceae bacterium]
MYDYFSAKLNEDEIRAISSIGLAHLGDAVYELLVRTYLCVHGKATGKGLHRATIALVCAQSQSRFSDLLLPSLTEEETAVFKRGRNANVHTIPHSADRAEYQKATGLEALFGYLYLQNRHERINELFDLMMEAPNVP